MSIPYPYPKIPALDKVRNDLGRVTNELITQEKFDGSNVSVVIPPDGVVKYYSRNQEILPEDAGSFRKFINKMRDVLYGDGIALPHLAHIEVIRNDLLRLGGITAPEHVDVILFGEMLGTGKIDYTDKLPFVLFDVAFGKGEGIEVFLAPKYLEEVATYVLNVPFAKVFWSTGMNDLPGPLTHSRLFEGVRSEGYVVKAYGAIETYLRAAGELVERYTPILAGKVVNDEYKETKTVKKEQADPLEAIGESLVTPARIEKARQRLLLAGADVSIVGNIIQEVLKDVRIEDVELIKQRLYDAYNKRVTSFVAKETIRLINEEYNNVGA